MQVGEWKAVGPMAATYRKACEMGLVGNIAELEAFGFTIIEPEKTGAPRGFAEQLLERILHTLKTEDVGVVSMNGHDRQPASGRQLFHLFAKDPIFVDAVMNPVMQIMASYLMGASYRLHTTIAFVKEGEAKSTHLHCDSSGVPPPLPFFSHVCNLSWVLTDYTRENGTFCMVPGSHRLCRHPTPGEQPGFMGGPWDDDMCVPVLAKPGSIVIFTGNTWHGTYPKTTDGTRIHLAMTFCRNYFNPAEDFSDIPEAVAARGGPEFARLLGRKAWQGYHAEGPQLERMSMILPAHASVYA